MCILSIAPFGDADRVATGHDRCPTWAADGLGVEAGELHSLCGHAIQVGRLDLPRSKAAEIAVPLIIRKDDNEVWLLRKSRADEQPAKRQVSNDKTSDTHRHGCSFYGGALTVRQQLSRHGTHRGLPPGSARHQVRNVLGPF